MSFPITTLEDADIDAVQGGATSAHLAEKMQKMQDFSEKIAASSISDKIVLAFSIAGRLRLALAGSAAPTGGSIGAGLDIGAQTAAKRAIA